MTETLIFLDSDSKLSLQSQIRQKLVEGIVNGTFPGGRRLPSSRKLAAQLGVARNTVVLAYDQLIEEGFLRSRERSGIYVNEEIHAGRVGFSGMPAPQSEPDRYWRNKIKLRPGRLTLFQWPADWQRHPYPFIDGYFDASLYPTAQWREANRMALGKRAVMEGSTSDGYADDPFLVEQIRTKMLPRRGINATADEILITLGEQNALYMLVSLLIDSQTKVAMEEPGNPKMRQLLQQSGASIIYQPVDEYGMVINRQLQQAQVIYVTPSHQVPTAVTMANQRRRALLKQAEKHDQLVIEDDFEHENNYLGQPHPALRGLDRDQRVIYVSALPRVLAPGLRIGFIVASPELIREARKLRQMVAGRPSMIAQGSAACFLSLGHYDALVARLNRVIGERWDALRQALNHYLRGTEIEWPTQGGTALWVRCPQHIGLPELVTECARRGILIEPDRHFYGGKRQPRNNYRLGVTSIPENRIRKGVQLLSETIRGLLGDRLQRLDPNDQDLCTGEEIRENLSGASLLLKTFYGVPCTIVLHPGGRMSGRSGHADEDRDEGEWWVEGDLYCRRWNQWSYGEVSKMRVTIHGDQIRWWRPEGLLVDTAIIHRDEGHLDS